VEYAHAYSTVKPTPSGRATSAATALNKERQIRTFDAIFVNDERKLSHYGSMAAAAGIF